MDDVNGMDQQDRFRILALDSGGIRGAFTASAHAEFERSTGCRCAEHFDPFRIETSDPAMGALAGELPDYLAQRRAGRAGLGDEGPA
jgi:hypothetical protein